MRPLLVLIKKELRQNAVLFFVPAVVLLVVLLAKALGLHVLSAQWLDMAAIAVPVALAAAYGLQAFDLEENSQTRDFLLTKPVAPGQIVAAKYLCGLLQLLSLAVLWELGLTPEAVKAPSFSDYSTFWLYTYLFLLAIVHGACFCTGVFITGPKKLLFGTLHGALAAIWFFGGFFGVFAAILYCLGQAVSVWAWLVILFGLLSLAFLVSLFTRMAFWSLIKAPFTSLGRPLLVYATALCLLPLAGWAASTLARPAIRPFSSLFATFFGNEKWFVAIEAAKQPGGGLYAFADAHGRLGVSQKGHKPKVVYESLDGKSPLSSLAWSPDGRRVAFCEGGLIKAYEEVSGKVIAVARGEEALWSTDPDMMLVLSAKSANTSRCEVYLADFARKTATRLGSIEAPGFALAWDARSHQLLLLDKGWKLGLVSLDTGRVRTVDLAPHPGPAEIAFAGRIFPPGLTGGSYRIAVYASGRGLDGKRRRFNVYFYDIDPRHQRIAQASVLRAVSYEELVADPTDREVLGRIGQGVYRIVPVPEEVS